MLDATGDERGGADVGAIEEGAVDVVEDELAEGFGFRERGAARDDGEGAGAGGDEGVVFHGVDIYGAKIEGGVWAEGLQGRARGRLCAGDRGSPRGRGTCRRWLRA